MQLKMVDTVAFVAAQGFAYDAPMPTIRGIPGPYRLFFVSFDCHEPQYVHVQRERRVGKYWMEPITLADNHGFSAVELNLDTSVDRCFSLVSA